MMAKKPDEFQSTEITNPRETEARRERAAGLDAGDISGPNADMFKPGSQAAFSKFSGKKGGPPEAMLKKRASKE
jgi:hypothetical protein